MDQRFSEGRGGDDDENGHCDSLRRAAGQDEGSAARGHIRIAEQGRTGQGRGVWTWDLRPGISDSRFGISDRRLEADFLADVLGKSLEDSSEIVENPAMFVENLAVLKEYGLNSGKPLVDAMVGFVDPAI